MVDCFRTMPQSAVNRSKEIMKDLKRMADDGDLHPTLRKMLNYGAADTRCANDLSAHITFMAGSGLFDAIVGVIAQKDMYLRLRATVLTQMLLAFCMRDFGNVDEICGMDYEVMVEKYTTSMSALCSFWASYAFSQ